MCCEFTATSWSRLALLLGLAAITLQALSLFTGNWITTREVLEPPPGGGETTVRYGSVIVYTRVGMLRTCVRVEKINATFYPYPPPQPSCFPIASSVWQDVSSADLGILHGSIPSTAQVVTNVRQYTLLLGSMTLGLMGMGQLVALVAHFRSSVSVSVVIACYLYLFAGLVVCLLVVSFSLIAEVPRREYPETLSLPAHKLVELGSPFSWELGTSYYLGVAAFALTHIIAAVLVSAFMKRFSSMEAMVREVVPGADRKLREHQENNLVGLWEIYPSRAVRQLGCITLPGGVGCYGKLGERSKAKPDICSSNPETAVDSLQQQLQQHLQAEDGSSGNTVEAGQDHQMRPVSPPFEAGGNRSVSLGQPLSLTTGQPAAACLSPAAPGPALNPDCGTLAGVSVPITVMRPRPLLGNPLQHRASAACGAEDDATPLDTFPTYGGPGGVPDGTMTVARRKAGPLAGAAPCLGTLDGRSRCGAPLGVAAGAGRLPAGPGHTHTLPHPPRQF